METKGENYLLEKRFQLMLEINSKKIERQIGEMQNHISSLQTELSMIKRTNRIIILSISAENR